MMKKLLFLVFTLSSLSGLRAQEQQNLADLDFLYQQIRELPSYKDQLKGDAAYASLYEQLRREMNTTDEFEVFTKLSRLILPLRDNHLGFYRAPDSGYRFSPPKTRVDSAALVREFENFPPDSVEGIYQGGNARYVMQRKQDDEFHLTALSSGLLAGILYRNPHGSYDMIQFLAYPYTYTLTRNVKLQHHILIGTNYYKPGKKSFFSLVSRKEKYAYKDLTAGIGYLSLGSFSSTDAGIKEATGFFDRVKTGIRAAHLIVDLRNNGGGGNKNSGQFLRFLKKFPGKIYLIQNAYTVSNAEQFILELKDRKNVSTFGETTRGTITYGSNYGKTLTLPGKRFLFYPTDMAGSRRDLAYESRGIAPDVVLDPFSEDWVAQVLTYIKTN